MKLTQEIDLDKKYSHASNLIITTVKKNNHYPINSDSVENFAQIKHTQALPKSDHYSTLDKERRISEKNDKISSLIRKNFDGIEDFNKKIRVPLENNSFLDFESIPKSPIYPNDREIEIPSHLMNMDMDMIDKALNDMDISRCEIEKEKLDKKETKDPTYFNYSIKSFNDSDILDRQNLDLSHIEKKEEKFNQSMFETLGKSKTLRKPPIPALNNLYQKADKKFLNRIQNILKNKETKKLNYASSEESEAEK